MSRANGNGQLGAAVYSFAEFAELAGIGERTVRDLYTQGAPPFDGAIPVIELGTRRVLPRSAVDAYLLMGDERGRPGLNRAAEELAYHLTKAAALLPRLRGEVPTSDLRLVQPGP